MKNKTKAKILFTVLAIIIALVLIREVSGKVNYTTVATTTPTRLEQTEQLITELTEARKKDQSFIDETNAMLKELSESRERQARLDALMIVQTRLEMEMAAIEEQQK